MLLQLLPYALSAQEGGPETSEGAAVFLDFSKAYDTVNRGFLLQAMGRGSHKCAAAAAAAPESPPTP